MDIAVMAYSYSRALASGELDLPAVVRRVRALGVSRLELMDTLLRPEEVPAVREALDQAGVALACYDLFCEVVDPAPAERRARLARFQAGLRQAAALGAKLVMTIPGLPAAGIDPLLTRQWFCEALRESQPEAARLGLTLMVENLGILADLYGRSEQIDAICAAVGPGLRVTFDAGNFLLAGEDNVQALDRLAPRIAHVHFKDWKVVPAATPCAYPGTDGRLYQGTALGEGLVNLPGVVRRLQGLGYGGAVSVEYEGPGDPDEAVRRGLVYLRGLLASAAGKNG
jgi:sugar phosphate isomerase/epimerase